MSRRGGSEDKYKKKKHGAKKIVFFVASNVLFVLREIEEEYDGHACCNMQQQHVSKQPSL